MKAQKRDFLYIIVIILLLIGITRNVKSFLAETIGARTNVVKASVLDYKVKKAQLVDSPINTPIPTPTGKVIFKYIAVKTDTRADRLKSFLTSKNSPLAEFAGYIIQQSDENAVEWTLVVSISGMESGFGKNIKQGCYNPFGIGGTSLKCFSSWEESIAYEAKLLGDDYRYNSTRGIQQKYCPDSECNPSWSQNVVANSEEILAIDSK